MPQSHVAKQLVTDPLRRLHLLGKPRVHSSSRRLQLGTNPVLTRHLRRALCRGALLQPSGESRDTVVVPAAELVQRTTLGVGQVA